MVRIPHLLLRDIRFLRGQCGFFRRRFSVSLQGY